MELYYYSVQTKTTYYIQYFMSKKTKKEERNYTSYELETLAIVEALRKFRVYLLGIQFKIITDCASFQRTMSKRELSTRIARWALILEDYDYIIEHKPGTRMKHVDASTSGYDDSKKSDYTTN